MVKLDIIGNLGADAELKEFNGSRFVSFNVGSTTKSTDRETGVVKSSTTWVSCTINWDASNLIQYLKKGTKVFVRGNIRLRVYKSKDGAYVPTIDLYVEDIELCGGSKNENTQTQNYEQNNEPF